MWPNTSFLKIQSFKCFRDDFMCWFRVKMLNFIPLSLRLSGIEFSLVSDCTVLPEAEFFHRTPAGHTAERKTWRERNRGCYELLSIPRQPSSLPSPPHRASVAPPAATLSGLAEGRLLPPPPPPPTHPPMAEFEQFSASSAKSEDGLYLGAWKCCNWIWTAFVIMYEFEVKW